MFVRSIGKKLAVFLMMIALVVLGACAQSSVPTPKDSTVTDDSGKLVVYTTFYPLYYIADRIGGNHLDVHNMIPNGVEPHDYEPTAKDIVAMSAANVFIYNGNGFEPWVENAVKNFDTSKMVVVKATEGLEMLPADHSHSHDAHNDHDGHDDHATHEDHAEHDDHATHEDHAEHDDHDAHEDEHAGEHPHDHGELDPHVWLDPTLLTKQAKMVTDAFVKADPDHAADYQRNFELLEADLIALDQQFQQMTAEAKRKEFIVSHSAFGYLAKRYGLEQIAISGMSPYSEPSPAKLKSLIEHVKTEEINYILFETLVSPKVAEVIARETGAKTATLNPLEGLTDEDIKAGKDYLTIMQENLETLKLVLNE